ncbi:universal stress protein UspA [Haloprofundus marisrubri]|uniref:Universal stress protein UspA n=1 Tax=Haloprofundus marisrubri TaxID=1514971 RepID=A0A0W1R987_9EURY|nr:universal stress protein [Haloprofundus marisrubri]KTG09866.1 universal stress protein UspA [Haloprofundus marisrubri]
MYHVLVGVDDDVERARSCAREVANLPGSTGEMTVTLLHAFDEDPGDASAADVESVRAAADYFDETDVAYELLESGGDAAQSILDAAERENADLIVVAGRKRSPAGKAIFGSVSQSVILSSQRPVLVAGTAPEE